MKNIVFILLILLFFACKSKEDKSSEHSLSNEQNSDSLKVVLPKVVILNEVVKGEIKFKSHLDSLSLSDKDKRFTILYVVTDTIEYETISEIEKREHQIFIEKEKGIIPFNCSFSSLGDNYFTGIIEDQVILDNYSGDGKARILTNETRIIVKVNVKSTTTSRL